MKHLVTILLLASTLSAKASITLGAYNIRNFDYDERSRVKTDKTELNKIIQGMNVDLLSVEEVNNTAEFERFVAKYLPGYDTHLTRCGGAHGQRLGFVFNKSKIELLSFNEDLSVAEPGSAGSCDSGSRPLAIGLFKIKSTGQKFYGMTTHLKSGSAPDSISKRTKQFEIIKNIIKGMMSKTGVKDYYIAGDFNTTEYFSGGSDYKMITKFAKDLGMMNMTQNAKCTAYWWGGTEDGIESPSVLDHIIVTPGLIKGTPAAKVHGHCKMVNCQEVPKKQLGASYERVSDHCPVTATIQQ